MSGCHHPTVTGSSRRVRVYSLEFNYHMEKSKSILSGSELADLKAGDVVELYETTVSSDRPTGRTCIKYVAEVIVQPAMFLDEDSVLVILINHQSMLEKLQTS